MNRATKLFACLLAIGFASARDAVAQGADDCTMAQPIAGLGQFPFDNNGASIDGPADCGSQPVRRDVWFAWTAPNTGGFILQTCGLTTLETRLAVYESLVCPPTVQLGCTDDICAGQTRLPFVATQGTQYLLRVGSRMVGDAGSGMIEITADPCWSMPDDSLEPNDVCGSPALLGSGTNLGLFVSKPDPDFYEFGVMPGVTLDIQLTFTHANGDIDAFLFDSCGGTVLTQGTSGSDNESLTWMNAGASCATVRLRVEHWFPDQNGDCNNYDMAVTGAAPCGPPPVIGTPYCMTSANSAGSGALISAMGSDIAANQNVTLEVAGLPNDTTGLFFAGTSQMQIPFGQGFRCVGGPSLSRIQPPSTSGPTNGNAAGTATLQLDFSANYGVLLMPGSVDFQFWYPDVGVPAFNLSDAIEILFQ